MLRRAAGAGGHEGKSAWHHRGEYVDILAKRVVFSRAHVCLCSSILVASVVEVLWILLPMHSASGQLPDHPLFTLVESYVTLGLVIEITLRALLEKRSFCRRWSNVFDVVVAAVSIASSALFVAGLANGLAEKLLETIVVTARVVFRLLRLLSLSRSFRQQRSSASQKHLEVRMDDLSPRGAGGAAGWGHGEVSGDGGDGLSPRSRSASGAGGGGSTAGREVGALIGGFVEDEFV